MRISHERGVRRNEPVVADVMTPIDDIVAMRMEDVRSAKVGHIVASLKAAGRRHELVAEQHANGRPHSRHLLGVADRAAARHSVGDRRTGAHVAEIEQALATSR